MVQLCSLQMVEAVFAHANISPGSPARHVFTAIPSQRTAIAPPASVSSRDDCAIQALRCRGAHGSIQGGFAARQRMLHVRTK